MYFALLRLWIRFVSWTQRHHIIFSRVSPVKHVKSSYFPSADSTIHNILATNSQLESSLNNDIYLTIWLFCSRTKIAVEISVFIILVTIRFRYIWFCNTIRRMSNEKCNVYFKMHPIIPNFHQQITKILFLCLSNIFLSP